MYHSSSSRMRSVHVPESIIWQLCIELPVCQALLPHIRTMADHIQPQEVPIFCLDVDKE